ncbi:hypothetical protein NLX86_29040 [Streptomyces sp. A3M-1-3]|uniref:hypothetical protein n=1 Tax=Streptomyces sp. A3M-1-3 TaxID=2962044 RepID=UPI0020B6FA6F|nr:hypothetical protein [Streptomyces sp. A3M-1-3]MCP3821986.1 hypothetical protein [Streptomyces sp. A3M-1-3]
MTAHIAWNEEDARKNIIPEQPPPHPLNVSQSTPVLSHPRNSLVNRILDRDRNSAFRRLEGGHGRTE